MLQLPKIIRIPEKAYIQTLIVGGLTVQQVLDEMKRLQLSSPEDYLPDIYTELKMNIPEFFKTKQLPDEVVLEDIGVSPMYFYRFKKSVSDIRKLDGCEGAFKMLEDPQIRKFITALSLAGVNPTDIELLINGRYSIAYDSPDFQIYLKYFSNFEEWTYVDKEYYIERMTDTSLKAIMRKAALKGDRHYLVWLLGLGTDPHMSIEQVMRDMIGDTYFLFKENIKSIPDDALKFANLMLKLKDRIDESESRKRDTTTLLDEIKIKLLVSRTSETKQIIDIKDIDVQLPKVQQTPTNLQALNFENK